MAPVNFALGQEKGKGMSRKITIASLKTQAALWDAQENLRRLEPLVRQAAAKGANIILTPECLLSGYNVDYEVTLDNTEIYIFF